MRTRKTLAILALVAALGTALPTAAAARVPATPRIVQVAEIETGLLDRLLSWIERASAQWLSGYEAAEGASMTPNG